MAHKRIIIGSRASKLAVIQSEIILRDIAAAYPDFDLQLYTMKTTGDKILDKTLDQIGGKGLFVKELDHALMEGKADITVHSLKDMPMRVPEEIPLAAFSVREDPRDVLILPEGQHEIDLSKPIGTSSKRRALQIKKLLPGATTAPIRGNVETRIRKMDEGQYSAVVLAAAGVKRLGLEHRINRYFEIDEMIPASCQGILAVQARKGETEWIRAINNTEAERSALAERAFVREIGADCGSPDTSYSWVEGDTLHMIGLRYDATQGMIHTGRITGDVSDPESLGKRLARRLLAGTGDLTNKGKVWLVGAGPGDPQLITLKGKEVLAKADTIVYDALIDGGTLAMMPPEAELIYAGKRSGNHTLRQELINEVLLDKALEGKQVVRLKGGDPFVFGRGGEELELLTEYNIPYEIVPGVTSAVAVPAYAGIPVTHRDYCSGVQVVTGHRRNDHKYDIDFDGLVKSRNTIVFLMGIAALPALMQGLLDAGMDPEMPAAIIEKGTIAEERTIMSTVACLAQAALDHNVVMPAIIVVGKVVSLGKKFSWREHLPLAGVRAIVTRPRELSSVLAAKLRDKGAEVIELPTIRIEPVSDDSEFAASIDRLAAGKYDWVVLTSPSGVRIFADQIMKTHDLRILAGCRIACLGKGSAGELLKYGIKADFVPSVFTGKILGQELAGLLSGDERILIPRARIGSRELIKELSKKDGIRIDDIPTYETVYTKPAWFDADKNFSYENTFAIFTSASTVKGFVSGLAGFDYRNVKAVCIGEMTAKEAAGHGMMTYTAAAATLDSLVELLEDITKGTGDR